jgi:hypothetical protein
MQTDADGADSIDRRVSASDSFRLRDNLPVTRHAVLPLATLILLAAALLRLWQVGALPPGLHYDEAADTIIAREIAEGQSAPLFVEAYTGKEALFFYWAAAWMRLVGATPFAMRLAAAMMGVLTVAATVWAVRELFSTRSRRQASPTTPSASGLALLAAAFVATSFWHVSMSRLGFRSIAEPCLQAFALAALWRGARLNHRGWLAAGGALVGLNLYTYLAARLFPVAIALGFAHLIIADKDHRRKRLIQFGLVALAALVVFIPLGLYFLQNPDAFLTRIAQVAPREGQSAGVADNLLRALGMFFVAGDPYIRFNLPGRPLFPALLGVLFVLGVGVALAGAVRSRDSRRRVTYLCALTSTLIMLLPTALAVNEISPSNLRAIGMMPMVFVFPALGAWTLVRWGRNAPRKTGAFVMGRSSFVMVAFALILLATFADGGQAYFGEYVRLPQLYYESDGDLVDIANDLNRPEARQATVYVHALHYRHPTLAALARAFHNLRFITGADVLVLPPGESRQVFAHLALPDRVWLERYLPDSARVETVPGPDGSTSYQTVHVAAPPAFTPSRPLQVNFGDTLELFGADWEPGLESGGVVDVTLFWRVRNSPARGDYAVFVELRDAWDFQWGQADSFDYPAEQWTAGEVFVQRLRVPIAPGAPPGDYRLNVGWYSAGADRRLPVVAEGGRFGGTVASVAPMTIARAPQPPADDSLVIGARMEAQAVDGLRLLGASLETPVAPQGAPLFFTLFWRTEHELSNQSIAIRLRSTGNPAAGEYRLWDGAPVHGTYPFDEWEAGEVVADRYGLRVPVDTAAGDYTLEARVGQGAWIEFGHARVEASERRFDVPPIAHPLNVAFGGQIELLGYDVDREQLRAGESLTLTLVWRALTAPDSDYTVFTHLLDPAGVQRGGKDNAPVNGAYNTSRWIAGEVVVDTYRIPLEAGAPPGEYTIEIGFYRFDSGARLPSSLGGDALRLTTIRVVP